MNIVILSGEPEELAAFAQEMQKPSEKVDPGSVLQGFFSAIDRLTKEKGQP